VNAPPRAVLDANVAAAGMIWTGENHRLLVALARRRFQAYGTKATLAETEAITRRLKAEFQPGHNPLNALAWYLSVVAECQPAPLGKTRSRDSSDDVYLAAALSCRAQFIVTHDLDLLVLGKPFGLEILKPSGFLRQLPPAF
jgi:putative PIN family toxin of toxin-antitoxin system